MKLIIDISEEAYAQIMDENGIDTMLIPYSDIIRKGTPLPEHHGRLIDADELKRTMEKDVRRALSFVDLTDFVWLAPTIIEGSESE